MSVSLLHKRSSTNNAVPNSTTLDVGEIALNTRNNKMFIRNAIDDSIVTFCPLNDGDKGDITVSNNGQTFTLDNSTVTVAKISATGTADNTTFLRGDGAWAVPSGGGGGGGGTKTYAIFTPLDSQPTSSNLATLDTRNSIMVLDFDATTDESTVFVGIIPEGATLTSGLKIRLHWMASTATSGTCRWGAQIEKMNTDLDTDSFDTAATAGSATNGTSGIITVTEITITTIDSIAAGDSFRLKIYRDADGTSGTDDMAGDAELVCVEVRSAA